MTSEHNEQVIFVNWARVMAANGITELALLFAIPNGGKRSIGVAKKLKSEGVLSGVPDLFLPVARKGKHGLFIEMKREKGGSISKSQNEMISRFTEQGFECVVCCGANEAINAVIAYIGVGK